MRSSTTGRTVYNWITTETVVYNFTLLYIPYVPITFGTSIPSFFSPSHQRVKEWWLMERLALALVGSPSAGLRSETVLSCYGIFHDAD